MLEHGRLTPHEGLLAWFLSMSQSPPSTERAAEFLLWRLCESLRSERSQGVRKWLDGFRVFMAVSKDPLADFLAMESTADSCGCQVLELIGSIAEEAIRFNQGDIFFQSMQVGADATRLVVFRFFAAWTALNLGRLEQCVEECEKVDEPFAAVFTLHGQALLELGRGKEAIEVLDVAVKLSPQEPLAWFQLAKARHVAGQVALAFEALRQCRQILPNSTEVALYMGLVALDFSTGAGVDHEAMEAMGSMLPQLSSNPIVVFTMLRLACRCRQRERATDIFESVDWREVAAKNDVLRSLPPVLRGLHDAGWMDLAAKLLGVIAPAI